MRVFFQSDTQWAEASIENTGEPFPTGFADAAARSLSAVLGVSVKPVVTDDGKDPREGKLLVEPSVTIAELNLEARAERVKP